MPAVAVTTGWAAVTVVVRVFTASVTGPPGRGVFCVGVFDSVYRGGVHEDLRGQLVLAGCEGESCGDGGTLTGERVPGAGIPCKETRGLGRRCCLFNIVFGFLFAMVQFGISLL